MQELYEKSANELLEQQRRMEQQAFDAQQDAQRRLQQSVDPTGRRDKDEIAKRKKSTIGVRCD
jgi:hypothetical protein